AAGAAAGAGGARARDAGAGARGGGWRSLASASASVSKSAVVRARPGKQTTGRARFVRAPWARTCNLRPSCALKNTLWPAAGPPSSGRSLSLCGIGAQPMTWSVGPYEGWYHLSRGARRGYPPGHSLYDDDHRPGKSAASDGPDRGGGGGL